MYNIVFEDVLLISTPWGNIGCDVATDSQLRYYQTLPSEEGKDVYVSH